MVPDQGSSNATFTVRGSEAHLSARFTGGRKTSSSLTANILASGGLSQYVSATGRKRASSKFKVHPNSQRSSTRASLRSDSSSSAPKLVVEYDQFMLRYYGKAKGSARRAQRMNAMYYAEHANLRLNSLPSNTWTLRAVLFLLIAVSLSSGTFAFLALAPRGFELTDAIGLGIVLASIALLLFQELHVPNMNVAPQTAGVILRGVLRSTALFSTTLLLLGDVAPLTLKASAFVAVFAPLCTVLGGNMGGMVEISISILAAITCGALLFVTDEEYGRGPHWASATSTIVVQVGLMVFVNVLMAHIYEDISRMSFIELGDMDERRLQTNAFLENVMPLPVLLRFAEGQLIRDEFSLVGVCFVKILNYGEIVRACGNEQHLLIGFFEQIKEVVHQIDDFVAARQVFKVEHIMPDFVISTRNVLSPSQTTACKGEVAELLSVALDLVQNKDFSIVVPGLYMRDVNNADGTHNNNDGREIKLKLAAGVHVGELVAGIIGDQRKFFRCFGTTMNWASRLCATSKPSAVHISEDVQRYLNPIPAEQHHNYVTNFPVVSWVSSPRTVTGKVGAVADLNGVQTHGDGKIGYPGSSVSEDTYPFVYVALDTPVTLKGIGDCRTFFVEENKHAEGKESFISANGGLIQRSNTSSASALTAPSSLEESPTKTNVQRFLPSANVFTRMSEKHASASNVDAEMSNPGISRKNSLSSQASNRTRRLSLSSTNEQAVIDAMDLTLGADSKVEWKIGQQRSMTSMIKAVTPTKATSRSIVRKRSSDSVIVGCKGSVQSHARVESAVCGHANSTTRGHLPEHPTQEGGNRTPARPRNNTNTRTELEEASMLENEPVLNKTETRRNYYQILESSKYTTIKRARGKRIEAIPVIDSVEKLESNPFEDASMTEAGAFEDHNDAIRAVSEEKPKSDVGSFSKEFSPQHHSGKEKRVNSTRYRSSNLGDTSFSKRRARAVSASEVRELTSDLSFPLEDPRYYRGNVVFSRGESSASIMGESSPRGYANTKGYGVKGHGTKRAVQPPSDISEDNEAFEAFESQRRESRASGLFIALISTMLWSMYSQISATIRSLHEADVALLDSQSLVSPATNASLAIGSTDEIDSAMTIHARYIHRGFRLHLALVMLCMCGVLTTSAWLALIGARLLAAQRYFLACDHAVHTHSPLPWQPPLVQPPQTLLQGLAIVVAATIVVCEIEAGDDALGTFWITAQLFLTLIGNLTVFDIQFVTIIGSTFALSFVCAHFSASHGLWYEDVERNYDDAGTKNKVETTTAQLLCGISSLQVLNRQLSRCLMIGSLA